MCTKLLFKEKDNHHHFLHVDISYKSVFTEFKPGLFKFTELAELRTLLIVLRVRNGLLLQICRDYLF